MKTVAIIVAAGRGRRAGDDRGVKQYVAVAGHSVLARAVTPFLAHSSVTQVLPVIHADDHALYDQAMAGVISDKLLRPVVGGATRQQSVLAGLRAVAEHAPDTVLIHDAARPFVSPRDIEGVHAALAGAPGAIVAVADRRYAETRSRRAADDCNNRCARGAMAGADAARLSIMPLS